MSRIARSLVNHNSRLPSSFLSSTSSSIAFASNCPLAKSFHTTITTSVSHLNHSRNNNSKSRIASTTFKPSSQQQAPQYKQKRSSGQTFSKTPVFKEDFSQEKFRVAIIGRPNTGKSTLFNALTGRYHAIVDKTAGVTRDCQEGSAKLKLNFKILGDLTMRHMHPTNQNDGKRSASANAAVDKKQQMMMLNTITRRSTAIECTMIDTPGADNIDRMIVQTEESVKSADVAIILTDYKTGIQEWDIEIARYVMLKGIPAIHVVNKVDHMEQYSSSHKAGSGRSGRLASTEEYEYDEDEENDEYGGDDDDTNELELHKLPGMGTPIPLSAERKYGLGDLSHILQPFYTRYLMKQFLIKQKLTAKNRLMDDFDGFYKSALDLVREQKLAQDLEEAQKLMKDKKTKTKKTKTTKSSSRTEDGEHEEEEEEQEKDKDPKDDTIRLAIIGRANVGKSTMLNQLIGRERVVVSPIPGTTRDTIEVQGVSMGRRILLADTAGMRKQKHIFEDRVQLLSAEDTLRTIRYSHIVILLIDAKQPLTNEDLEIAAMIEREGRGIVVGANKWDLVTEPLSVATEIEKKVVHSLSQIQGLSVVVTSGLKNSNLKLLMKKAIETFDKWNFRISTSRLNAFIQQFIASKQFPASFPKIQYMTQVNSRPPTFAIFFKRGEELPRNFERQITNAIRTEFSLDGIPIRIIQKSSTVRSREEKAKENRKIEREIIQKRASRDPEFAAKVQKVEEKKQEERAEKRAKTLQQKNKLTRREQRRHDKKMMKRVRTRRYRKKNQ